MDKLKKSRLINHLYQLKLFGFNYIKPINFNKKENLVGKLSNNTEEIETIISNCSLCTFSKNRKHVLVGRGNINSKVVFLNMAPNSIEDETGQLLSGNSGDTLKKMCENVLNISVDDVYVLNVLKCKPSKEIFESSEEINICKPYFQKQLDIINPKLIISLGEASNYLLDDTRDLSLLRGSIQYYNDTKVITTYDPSFILRNPSIKEDVLNDLKKAKLIMESI